jgi:rare lipoprotein A
MSILNSSKLRHRISSEGNISRKRRRVSLLAVALGLTATVVASPPVAKTNCPQIKPTATPKHHWFEIGKASWYGGKFNGRKTADGERFDMYALTCAHRSLPLGSWVRVTNLHNKKSVFLRVNDRGPMAESLIVDLSYAAAQRLGISGLGKVKIEEVAGNDPKMTEELVASLKPADLPQWPVAKGLNR